MIGALILTAAIALVLVIGAIVLVLTSEIRKQKRPSRFRFRATRQKQQLTPAQLKMVESLKWIGIPGGMLLSTLVRTGALSMLDAGLITLIVAVVVGILTWLVLQNHSSTAVALSARPLPPTDLQRQLIRMCGGDRQTAERLAALEGGNWQAAIDKLIRDRR